MMDTMRSGALWGVLVGAVRHMPSLHDLDAVEATAPLHVDVGSVGAWFQRPGRQLDDAW